MQTNESKKPGEGAWHPDPRELTAFARGTLNDDHRVTEIDLHLEFCDACSKQVENTPGDWLENLVAQLNQDEFVDQRRNAAPFELIDEIGRGGTGLVYRARQVGLNRDIAVKMLIGGANASHAEIARFRREAQALAKIHHKNIVQILDCGDQDGVPYLAMEFVNGIQLSKQIQSSLPSARQAASIVRDIACAIHQAHQQGIIHRDLKPQNVLLAAPDREHSESKSAAQRYDWTVKVVDFGLSRFDDQDFATLTDQVIGTPAYIAPEMVQGASKTEPAVDIYGIGTILYECLTGRPPFAGSSAGEILNLVSTSEPLSIQAQRPNVPKELCTICERCLAKNPNERFPNAQELAEDLTRFLDGRPIHSQPISKLEKCARWCRRHPWQVVSALLLVLSIVAILTTQLIHQNKLAEQRDRAQLQYRESRSTIWKMLDAADSESAFDIPRLGELTTEQATQALALFEQLAEEEKSSQSRQDLARIKMRLGSMLLVQGEFERGKMFLVEAHDAIAELEQSDPDNRKLVGALIESQIKLGAAFNFRKDYDNSIAVLMLAHQSAIRENKRNPGKAVHLNQIGWASHNIGAARFSQKKYNEASERFEESVVARTEALAAQPGNFDLVKSIAESQLMAASCYMVLKRSEEARSAYRAAIQNLEKLTEDQPGNPEALVSAAVAYLNLSNLNANSGKLKNAIENCTKGIQLLEPFIKVEPKHRLARTELAKLYANRAIFNHHGLYLDQAVMDCKTAIRHAPSGNIEQTCQTLLVGYLIEQENFQLAAETAMEIDTSQWIPYYRFLLLKSMARLLNRADQDQNLLKDLDQRNLQQAADVLYETLEKERYFQKSSGAKDRLFEIRKFGLPG